MAKIDGIGLGAAFSVLALPLGRYTVLGKQNPQLGTILSIKPGFATFSVEEAKSLAVAVAARVQGVVLEEVQDNNLNIGCLAQDLQGRFHVIEVRGLNFYRIPEISDIAYESLPLAQEACNKYYAEKLRVTALAYEVGLESLPPLPT